MIGFLIEMCQYMFTMILEKLRLDPDSRQEKRINKNIRAQADKCVEQMIDNDPGTPWGFGVGKAPETMTVNEFAKAVGTATIRQLSDYTRPMEIAEVDWPATIEVNSLQPGIGEDALDIIPPPQAEVTVMFKRTATGQVYNF